MTGRLTPVRLVQIGMGGWGRDWSTVTQQSADVTPVGYVDASPAALAATAARGVPAELLFADLESAVRTARPEAALVTTSVGAHAPVALAALAAGLHVLVEKPFAPTLAEAETVVRAAGDRVVAVSQNYRHHPAALLAADLVRSGRIGAVRAVEIDFRRPGRRMIEEAVLERGLRHPLLVDMAIHQFDLLRTVLGTEPTWIECHGSQPLGPHADPLAAYATIGLPGALASYRGNWVSNGTPTAWAGEWRIEGTDAALEWTGRGDPGVPDRVHLLRPDHSPDALPLPSVPALGRAGVLRAFTTAIRTGSEPASSGTDNLRTLALTLAAVRSATESRRIDLPA